MDNKDCIHASDIKKDRGDSLKRMDKSKTSNVNEKPRDILSDRGDPDSKMQKCKLSKSINENVDVTVPEKNTVVSDKHLAKRLIEKKRIREKYTIKLKSKCMDGKSNVKDSIEINNNKSNHHNDGVEVISNVNSIKTNKETDIKEKTRKSPVIKTITSKSDVTKFYKAVTFTEQKERTPLEIKIPNATWRKTNKSVKSQNSASRTSVKPNKLEKNKRRYRSPISLDRESGSPPTEVAKWAPNCVNEYTKPYYEAWVNTFTAISRNTKKGKSIQNGNIIKTFQKLLERPKSPDLIHENYLDERYIGKIKINHS